MPNYTVTIRKRRVLIVYPVFMVGKGDNNRIFRKIGGAVERGDKSGEIRLRPNLEGAKVETFKWRVVTRKPGAKKRRT